MYTVDAFANLESINHLNLTTDRQLAAVRRALLLLPRRRLCEPDALVLEHLRFGHVVPLRAPVGPLVQRGGGPVRRHGAALRTAARRGR